jgi:hypothetical protein
LLKTASRVIMKDFGRLKIIGSVHDHREFVKRHRATFDQITQGRIKLRFERVRVYSIHSHRQPF